MINNICKSKKFPANIYDIYRLSKKQLASSYLNLWFYRELAFKVKSKNIECDSSEFCTVRKVDECTKNFLYGRRYNPVCLRVKNYRILTNSRVPDQDAYSLYTSIWSIDDSQYGIRFDNFPKNELEEKRLELMEWINQQKLLNGDRFIEKCLMLGANEQSIDYT